MAIEKASMKKPNRKRIIIISSVFLLTVLLTALAFRTDLNLVSYDIKSSKIDEDIKIALVADLHSCDYGEGQADLIRLIDNAAPDIVLLGGDIVDDQLPQQKAFEFLSAVSEDYPCYYVSGNHEFWSGKIAGIKADIKALGIKVLEGERADIEIKGQSISLFGIDDPEVGEDEFARQLKRCGDLIDETRFSLLLTHRPERLESYLAYGYDLILAGHTHGGQIRIPLLVNGLFAPDQGWFPQYAGGLYNFDKTQMIVSRGATRQKIRMPRLFNKPELVMIDLLPDSNN